MSAHFFVLQGEEELSCRHPLQSEVSKLMPKALFQGLVVDERDYAVELAIIGGDSFYVIDDDGFKRHVESEYVDRQVLDHLRKSIEGHEDIISASAMQMMGQEDIFTKAMIERSLENLEPQIEDLLQQGLPETARTWLGMMGFKVVIDVRGDVLNVEGAQASFDDE